MKDQTYRVNYTGKVFVIQKSVLDGAINSIHFAYRDTEHVFASKVKAEEMARILKLRHSERHFDVDRKVISEVFPNVQYSMDCPELNFHNPKPDHFTIVHPNHANRIYDNGVKSFELPQDVTTEWMLKMMEEFVAPEELKALARILKNTLGFECIATVHDVIFYGSPDGFEGIYEIVNKLHSAGVRVEAEARTQVPYALVFSTSTNNLKRIASFVRK